jgi:putative peptidoglycan lipid II flippase
MFILKESNGLKFAPIKAKMKNMLFSRFFNFQTKNITAAAGILAFSALFSRILGLLRDRLLAGRFGASSELDVYFAAFRIPDFIYNILIAGGVIVALVPLFSEYFIKDSKEAWKFVSNILNVFLVLLAGISDIIFIFAPFFVKIITPGFDGQKLDLTIFLTRILLLSPIFLGLSSIFSGILQYFNRFLAYGLAPILYNAGIIVGIVFFAPSLGILGVVLGVILGAFLHFVFQIPSAVKAGFSYKFILDFKDSRIKRIFSLMIPRTFGVAAPQINLMVVTALSSLMPAGTLAIFSLSINLSQFPMGLFGIPFAVAAFPVLSRAFASSEKEEFLKHFYATFRKILFITLPLSVVIFLARNQIVEIIYKSGSFGQTPIELTAACLGLFALGIWSSCLIPLVLRGFFALQDTKTPTIISVLALVLNVALSLFFVWLLGFPNIFSDFIRKALSIEASQFSVTALPLAYSLDATFQFSLLIFLFRKKINRKFTQSQI